jgi:hypothetical protein
MINRLSHHASRGTAAALVLVLLTLTAGSAVTSHAKQSSNTAQATASPSPCSDSFEDDGVPAQAKTIVLGETQTHVFCPAGDADWLVFFANEGKGYGIETSELTVGVDTYLNLFAPDGRTLLTTNDDAPGAHGPSRLLFYPSADGWYYVQAKNQGNIGYAGLHYSINLQQVDQPTGTPTRSSTATPTPTRQAPPTATPTQPAFATGLLHPQKGDGGVDVFTVGPQDGMLPDGLEPNDSGESARPISVGAAYKYLNFVPRSQAPADADFYTFRAKPSLCYLVQTGDLSAGLDTTILLWQEVAAKERWKLVAQNDDAQPRTPNLGSAVRVCTSTDSNMVVEVRNYDGTVATDPHGKSYSLSLLIDPPTPTPTSVPPTTVSQRAPAQPQPPQPQARTDGQGAGPAPVTQAQQAQQQQPTRVVQAQVASPTAVPPTATIAPTATPIPASPTAAPSATPAPPNVSVDVVAYIADAAASGPNPGDGIVELPVLLVDLRTNAVIQRAVTDENGHAQLSWQWQGPVRVAMPAFRWGRTLQLQDFTFDPDFNGVGTGGTDRTGARIDAGGTLLLQARMSSYLLPGIYP